MLTSRDFQRKEDPLLENRNAMPERAIPREFCESKDGTSGTIAISVI